MSGSIKELRKKEGVGAVRGPPPRFGSDHGWPDAGGSGGRGGLSQAGADDGVVGDISRSAQGGAGQQGVLRLHREGRGGAARVEEVPAAATGVAEAVAGRVDAAVAVVVEVAVPPALVLLALGHRRVAAVHHRTSHGRAGHEGETLHVALPSFRGANAPILPDGVAS